jgi:class 3 adenylate cyclase/tetratricopeptide (TPR) repeat protein/energy-coupling factor transporter ATP-binding protein EcfA2
LSDVGTSDISMDGGGSSLLDPWPNNMQLKSLHSFVPTKLLARMAGQERGGPTDVRFVGVVLFADISGYTPLAEQLCEQGTEGAESLSTILDQAFSHYVGCIHRLGGEVACFAGDALLAYWPVPGDDGTAALRHATECAAALHGPLLAGSSALPQKLELHVGLAVGPLWAARLGGVDGRWQILLAGPAVRNAGRAAAAAGRGATLLSPTTQIMVDVGQRRSDPIDSRAVVSAWSVADHGDSRPDDAIASLVPRVIQEWGHEDRWHWLPQFRNICALFVRIEGLDDDAPDALDRHQAAVIALQTAVSASSGSSGTLMMGDKGLVFQLCLGFPHDSHADDTSRAIRAGLAIEHGLKHLGLDCAAGLATGRGLCTALGGPERKHYVAVGRFMHLAARLMEHAGRGLLCTEEAVALVRGNVDWIAEHPLKLKGIAEDLRAVRVRALGQPANPEQTLFGRTAERRLLARHIAALERGEGAVVWITGDAGIGKSTLVDHITRLARSKGITYLVGDSTSTDNAISFLAWRRVFLELLRVDWPAATTPPCPTFAHEILADLQEKELAPLINSVLPALLEETDLVRGLSGKTRAEATLNVLSDVIRRTAGDRFLLVLEDCHWMDSASWRLVERVARDVPRALLVLTSRPHLRGGELDALRRLERFTELALGPLDDDAIEGIAGNILAGVNAQAEVIHQIVARSSGNPFFAREYSLLLRSNGQLSHSKEGVGRPGPPVPNDEPPPAPLTVQGLVASRLDALELNESVVVKAASVLGNQFDLPVFAGVVANKLHGVDLAAVLARLDRHHILSAIGEDSRYRFHHDIIRRVAYDQLTSSQKKDLHREAACVIESVYGGKLAPYFAILAQHWSAAGVPAATVKYSDLAAAQALASGAFVEAERLLQTCLQVTERSRLVPADTETLVRWHRELADVHQGLGQIEMRGIEARRALALAGRARPPALAGLVRQGVGRTARFCLRRASKAQVAAGGNPEETLILELARTYRHSAAVSWFANDSIGMTCDILGAVECAEAAPASGVLASAYAELGGILSVVGLRRVGARMLRRALAIAEISGDLCELAHVHLLTSLHAVGVGDWSTAARSSGLCQALCERVGDQVNWSNAQAIRFWLNYYQGRMEPALALANQLQDRAAQTRNRQHQAWALRFLAVCDLRQGRPAEAAWRLDQALQRLGETAALNERIPIIGSLALAHHRLGEETTADETAREGLALVRSVVRPAGHATLEGYSALTEVVLDSWRAAPRSTEWQRETAVCMRALQRYRATFPIGEPCYWVWLGRYRHIAGRNWLARASFRRAASAARRLSMPWDEARSLEALKRVSALRFQE